MSQQRQQSMTPDDALAELRAGNNRFVDGQMQSRDLMAQVHETASGQYPFAVVLGCIDSRVPPEVIFDQGIGELFSPRIAGNFVNTDILGSMEFATKLAGSKLIVVLGHTSCGAVKGACDCAELGNLTDMLQNLKPAVDAVNDIPGEQNSSNAEYVQAVAECNVVQTVDEIPLRSPVIRELMEEGAVKVVGAMYDVASGQVRFLD